MSVPTTVAKVCAERGCRQLAYIGNRCAPHKLERERVENARRNKHPRRRVYDDPRWPATRAAVFTRDGFTCVDCGFHGLRLICAHKTPVLELMEQGRDPFNPDECEALCFVCSGREDGARGTQGARGKASHAH